MGRRWDTDERNHGVTDARRFAPDIAALADAMATPDWVAEEPDVHLLPQITAFVAGAGGAWRLDGWRIDEGMLEVSLWVDVAGTRSAQIRAMAFTLLGTFAEAATLVRERRGDGEPGGEGDTEGRSSSDSSRGERRGDGEPGGDGERVFDVASGMLDGDGAFATHGHIVRLRIRGRGDG